MDLGECPKHHDLALKADYEMAAKEKDYYYDIDVSAVALSLKLHYSQGCTSVSFLELLFHEILFRLGSADTVISRQRLQTGRCHCSASSISNWCFVLVARRWSTCRVSSRTATVARSWRSDASRRRRRSSARRPRRRYRRSLLCTCLCAYSCLKKDCAKGPCESAGVHLGAEVSSVNARSLRVLTVSVRLSFPQLLLQVKWRCRGTKSPHLVL